MAKDDLTIPTSPTPNDEGFDAYVRANILPREAVRSFRETPFTGQSSAGWQRKWLLFYGILRLRDALHVQLGLGRRER